MGLTDEQAPGFIAWETQEGRTHPDESEELHLRKLHFHEVVDLVVSGQVVDAPSCALILTTYVRAQRGELPSDLLELVGVEARRDSHPIEKR